MKTLYICLALLLGTNTLLAQPGHIKQPPKINGVTKSVSNANARIHANSNSIYGTSKSNAANNKKAQVKTKVEPRKESVNKTEVKDADVKKSKGRKHKIKK